MVDGRGGQVDDDGQSSARSGFGGHGPVHGFGESAGDGQAQAHAVAGWYVTHPLEWFENPAQGSCWNAGAVVDHPETDVHSPVGDRYILADLGVSERELLALDEGDALSTIADALGAAEVLETVR